MTDTSRSFHDLAEFADQELAPHKEEIGFIFHDLVDELVRFGYHADQKSVSEIAEDYGRCFAKVLSAVRYLEARGFVRSTNSRDDGDHCSCDSCLARHTYVQFNYSLDIDYKNLLAKEEQDKRTAEAKEKRQKFFDRSSSGYVYLMKAGPRYKIGISTSVERRLAQLNGQQSPYPVELIHYVQCERYRELEKELHATRDWATRHGEWFEFDETEVVGVIAAMDRWVAACQWEADHVSNG